ncbi:hypothetical protein GPJ56_009476 [Histomonas meleagridis]|uniref:uncharacterized protein n=1 Tax=Histomonas meleagridis TaxID=135588 RepID=UPI00355A1321|nr:hypothetical protein GPJ56_009476 [Histomonas meleagridis]KAH0804617.1 hypothetical protein GO595_002553 [Histomonas meleagridis]
MEEKRKTQKIGSKRQKRSRGKNTESKTETTIPVSSKNDFTISDDPETFGKITMEEMLELCSYDTSKPLKEIHRAKRHFIDKIKSRILEYAEEIEIGNKEEQRSSSGTFYESPEKNNFGQFYNFLQNSSPESKISLTSQTPPQEIPSRTNTRTIVDEIPSSTPKDSYPSSISNKNFEKEISPPSAKSYNSAKDLSPIFYSHDSDKSINNKSNKPFNKPEQILNSESNKSFHNKSDKIESDKSIHNTEIVQNEPSKVTKENESQKGKESNANPFELEENIFEVKSLSSQTPKKEKVIDSKEDFLLSNDDFGDFESSKSSFSNQNGASVNLSLMSTKDSNPLLKRRSIINMFPESGESNGFDFNDL